MFIICIIEEEYNIQKTICLILSVLVLNLAFPDVSSATEPNLVGWWKFDETSASTAYDSSGVGTSKSGTLNGGAAFTTEGYRNGAVQLDGASGYVSFPIDNFGVMVRDELEECTIAIWVYWDGEDMWQRIIDIGSSQSSYIYVTPYGTLGLHTAIVAGNNIWDGCGTGAGNLLPANGWHHVAVTVSDADSEMILYLDGEAVASKSGCTNSIDDIGRTSNNWLGRSQYWPSCPDPFFDGIVDDFKIYSSVLTRAEIRRTADPEKASMPEPADEDTIPKTSMILEWQAGIYADKHDVYFGSDVNDVREANTSNPMGVLLSQDQETTSYPVSGLVSGETYYWRIDEVNDACTPDPWKGRIWSFKAQPLKAYDPSPPNDVTGVFRYPTLSWEPGKYAADAAGHELYYGTSFDDVNDRAGDPVILNVPCYVIPSPNASYGSLQVIYWVVDEVNESHPDQIWPGNVWRFTIEDYTVIDDFETYTNTGKDSPPPEDTLKSVWVDGNYSWDIYGVATSGSLVQLNTDTYDGSPPYLHYQSEDIAQSGTQSMKFYYDNDSTVEWEIYLYGEYDSEYIYTPSPAPYLSEAYAAVDDAAADSGLDSLDMLRDWSIYNVLVLSFYGDPNNTTNHAGLYVGLEDTDGTLVTIAHPDPNLLTEPWWHNWYVKLSDFTDKNGGLDLENIVRIYLGFGDKDSPASGGSGVLFFDDIQLFTGVCIPGTVIGDFDDDCTVNNGDLEIFTYQFPGQTPTLPAPIIKLVASGTVGSPVTSWANTGSEGGTFTDVNAGDANDPVVEMVAGKKCVTFDATDMLIWNQNAPAIITGDSNYTVIYEVYNPTIDAEEWLLTWAQRGGPERSSGGVGYGTNAEWGCIIHWDPPGDMGFDLGVPVAKQWHTIAATYDGTTNAVIVDGLVHGLEDKVLLVYEDQPVTIGAGYEEPADANEAYILNKYVPTFDLRFTGSVASIRVYGEAVPPGDLAILTASLAGLSKAEADLKPDGKIDFKDLAVMGYKWMEDPYLFGEDY